MYAVCFFTTRSTEAIREIPYRIINDAIRRPGTAAISPVPTRAKSCLPRLFRFVLRASLLARPAPSDSGGCCARPADVALQEIGDFRRCLLSLLGQLRQALQRHP